MMKPQCCKEHITVHETPDGWAVNGEVAGSKMQAIAFAVRTRDSIKVLAGTVKPFVYIELSTAMQAKMPAGVWA